MSVSTVDIDGVLDEVRTILAERDADSAPSRLADLVQAIDAHMSAGGALPREWRTKSPCYI